MSWELASTAVLALVLAVGFAWYERRKPPARIVALVAALAALAVVGRLAFAAIPNVKPTTDIVLFAGYALGAVPGFAVGAITALVSNIFLGQGPWTAWQMVGWGGVGVAGAGLAKAYGERELGRVPLAIACGVAGLAFGALLDVYQTTLAARQDLSTYLAVSATSLPYNLAHAIGNVVFCLLIGPAFIRALRRYRRRFEVRWRPAAVVAGRDGARVRRAPRPPRRRRRPTRYLERAQNRDGGFGGGEGPALERAVHRLVGARAGRGAAQPARRRAQGRPVDHPVPARAARAISDLGELERTILVLKAAGISPRRFRGRNLVADLLRRQRADGSWQSNVALTTFGVLALRAGGEARGAGSVQRGAGYVERSQNADGGFGFVASAESDVDDTGAALQALAAAGRGGGDGRAQGASPSCAPRRTPTAASARSEGKPSNAQSTSWAVQGLVAVAGGRSAPTRSATSPASSAATATSPTRPPATRRRCGSPPRRSPRCGASRSRSPPCRARGARAGRPGRRGGGGQAEEGDEEAAAAESAAPSPRRPEPPGRRAARRST